MTFFKLDSGFVESTLWSDRDAKDIFLVALLSAQPYEVTEPTHQLEVFGNKATGYIVPPGWYGLVSSTYAGFSRRSGLPVEDTIAALTRLGSPEIASRSQEFDGRRMVRVGAGYIVLNFEHYAKKDHTSTERVRRFRAFRKMREDVAAREGGLYETHIDVDVDVDTEEEQEQKHTPLPPKGGRGGRRRKVDVKTTDLLPDSEKYFQVLWEDWPMAGTRKVERFGRMVDMEVVHERGSRARAERAYQKIIDAGVATPRELYGCAFIYWGEAQTKGFVQHVSTFFGPDKATWREYLTRAKEAIAIQDAEATQ